LTDIARQARSLQENFNESNVEPIEQPILETGSHSDNLQLLNVGFCLDYGVCLVYSLYYFISRYFVDTVTIKDNLMTEMKTDFYFRGNFPQVQLQTWLKFPGLITDLVW